MKTSSIAVETSQSTSQSDSIVRQTNKTFIPNYFYNLQATIAYEVPFVLIQGALHKHLYESVSSFTDGFQEQVYSCTFCCTFSEWTAKRSRWWMRIAAIWTRISRLRSQV